jgi:hypothetical protein
MDVTPTMTVAPTTGFPRAEWHTTRASARTLAIKRRLLETPREIDVERARFTTQSYEATEGEPMPIRRARMLLHLVQAMRITIESGELIAGNRSLLPRMGVIAPEGAVAWVDRELDTLPTRPQDRFNITPEQIQELRADIFPYWRGKTLEDTVAARVPADERSRSTKPTTPKATSCRMLRPGCGWALGACATACRRHAGGRKSRIPPTRSSTLRPRSRWRRRAHSSPAMRSWRRCWPRVKRTPSGGPNWR